LTEERISTSAFNALTSNVSATEASIESTACIAIKPVPGNSGAILKSRGQPFKSTPLFKFSRFAGSKIPHRGDSAHGCWNRHQATGLEFQPGLQLEKSRKVSKRNRAMEFSGDENLS
jgi:hypothetical protein